jgi:hypothetical protein
MTATQNMQNSFSMELPLPLIPSKEHATSLNTELLSHGILVMVKELFPYISPH